MVYFGWYLKVISVVVIDVMGNKVDYFNYGVGVDIVVFGGSIDGKDGKIF